MLITKETATQNGSRQDQGFRAWWKKNWKKVVAGIVIVGGTILVIKNWDEIAVVTEKLAARLKPKAKMSHPVVAPNVVEEVDVASVAELAKDAVRKSTKVPFDVIAHIRTLPDGWHASPEKIAEASELQIVLLPNQTLVDAYRKGVSVA